MRKPTGKAAAVKVPGRPFKKGDPRINRTKPGPGRTPDAFKKMCQAIACSGAEGVKRVMAMPDAESHPAFLGALKWATEHGYGKPKETIEKRVDATIEVKGTIEWGGTKVPL